MHLFPCFLFILFIRVIVKGLWYALISPSYNHKKRFVLNGLFLKKNQCFSVQYVAMAKCFTAAVVMCCAHSVCCLQYLFLFGLFLVFDWL